MPKLRWVILLLGAASQAVSAQTTNPQVDKLIQVTDPWRGSGYSLESLLEPLPCPPATGWVDTVAIRDTMWMPYLIDQQKPELTTWDKLVLLDPDQFLILLFAFILGVLLIAAVYKKTIE